MPYYIKGAAIAAIALLEGAAMYMGVNGDTLIYAIGAIAVLGGAETLEYVKKLGGTDSGTAKP